MIKLHWLNNNNKQTKKQIKNQCRRCHNLPLSCFINGGHMCQDGVPSAWLLPTMMLTRGVSKKETFLCEPQRCGNCLLLKHSLGSTDQSLLSLPLSLSRFFFVCFILFTSINPGWCLDSLSNVPCASHVFCCLF